MTGSGVFVMDLQGNTNGCVFGGFVLLILWTVLDTEPEQSEQMDIDHAIVLTSYQQGVLPLVLALVQEIAKMLSNPVDGSLVQLQPAS